MKSVIRLISCAFWMLAIMLMYRPAKAQAPTGDADMKSAVENRAYTFTAQTASPQGGGFIQLTPAYYTLKVKGDTLICDLPYYGRVYNASYGGDAGLKFTSVKYEYKVTPRKKGGWNIKIETKDLTTSRRLWITMFDNGSATVNFSSSDRQAISYQGSVAGKK